MDVRDDDTRDDELAPVTLDHTDGVVHEHEDALHPSYRLPPPGTVARRPQDADLPAIAALYERAATRAVDGSAGRGALRTATDLRRTWAGRRNDALVVEADADGDTDGPIVGYLEFHEQLDPWTPELDCYAEGRVDPAAAGSGVGSFLLGRAVDRARRAAVRHPRIPTVLRTTMVDPDPRTLAWLDRRGLHTERHMLQLRIDLSPTMPPPVWPAGVHGVDAATVPLAAVHAAVVASFADHHLGATEDLDTWRRVLVDSGRVDLAASLVAVADDGAVVGVALGRPGGADDPGLGVITDLGVVPAMRGAGLATALLRGMFARFSALGQDRVGLEVDDVTLDGALRLYQRAGMEVVHHTVVLRLEL